MEKLRSEGRARNVGSGIRRKWGWIIVLGAGLIRPNKGSKNLAVVACKIPLKLK